MNHFKKIGSLVMVCVMIFSAIFSLPVVSSSAAELKSSIGLTEFVTQAYNAGWGYLYGGYGQVVTETLIQQKAAAFPSMYTSDYIESSRAWIGKRSTDCSGLIKAYLWMDSINSEPVPYYSTGIGISSNGFAAASSDSGSISNIPNIHGLILWRSGHVGVYVGNGKVIHALNVKKGVICTDVDSTWSKWYKYKYLNYPETGWYDFLGEVFYYKGGEYVEGWNKISSKIYYFGKDGVKRTGTHEINGVSYTFNADGSLQGTTKESVTDLGEAGTNNTGSGSEAVLKIGSVGENVKQVQLRLIDLGFLNGAADGEFGPITSAAVKAFQEKGELSVTGIVDQVTLDLMNSENPPAIPNFNLILQNGSKGYQVKLLQLKLIEKGYLVAPANEVFDEVVEQAVKNYQATVGLQTTGIADNATLQLIYSDKSPELPTYETLKRGSKGEAVVNLQKRLIELGYLNDVADGEFGKLTEAAVMSFQTAIGLNVTGIADESTQVALYKKEKELVIRNYSEISFDNIKQGLLDKINEGAGR